MKHPRSAQIAPRGISLGKFGSSVLPNYREDLRIITAPLENWGVGVVINEICVTQGGSL